MDLKTALGALVQNNQRLTQLVSGTLDPAVAGLRHIGAYWREVRRIADAYVSGQGTKVRPYVLSLMVALSTATTSASDDDVIPTGFDFDVREVRGFLGFTNWASEPATVGNMNPLAADRVVIKARNCRIKLELKDTEIPFTKNEDLYLADILEKPLVFGDNGVPRFVIPAGETPKMTATLQDTNTNVVGQSTRYGVILVGALISKGGRE